MSRKQRTILLILVFWSVVIGIPGVLLWRTDRQQQLNRDLIEAIKRDDMPTALCSLAQGADANARDAPIVSPWQSLCDLVHMRHQTVSDTPPPLIVFLQHDPSRLNAVLDDVANRRYADDPRLAESLIAHGANVNSVNAIEMSALNIALHTRRLATSRVLIEHGANLKLSPHGEHLVNAVIYNLRDVDILELMLQHGADPNQADVSGATPLYYALTMCDSGAVQCLLRHHADANLPLATTPRLRPTQYVDWRLASFYSRTLVLHEAKRWTDIARILRNAGAR
jgi:hypothetical protein